MIVAPLCEQTLLYLYAVRSEFCILVPEENSFDWFYINFLAIIAADNSRWHYHFEQT